MMSILVTHCCITNHLILGGLQQPLFFSYSQVCGSAGKFLRDVVHGWAAGGRWAGLSGMAAWLSVEAVDVTGHCVSHH